MEGNYERPSITNRTFTDTGKDISCTLEWYFNAGRGNPAFFEVVYDNPERKRFSVSPYDREASFVLEYFSKFSAKVVAVFDIGPVTFVNRSSPLIFGNVSMGKPDRIEKLPLLEHLGSAIKLLWAPPAANHGPLSYQEVILFDPLNPLRRSSTNVTSGSSAILPLPELRGDNLEVWIRGVNVEPNGKAHKAAYASFHRKYIELPRPDGIRVLYRTGRRVIFQVFTKKPEMGAFFVFESEVSVRVLNSWQGKGEISDLTAFTQYKVSARLCYSFDNTVTFSCGGFAHFRLMSNVEAPSSIPSMTINKRDVRCFEVVWEPPHRPHGPIDGYQLLVNMSDGYSRENDTTELTVRERKLHHCTQRFQRLKNFTIRISAFNIDMENKSALHVSNNKFRSGDDQGSMVPGEFLKIQLMYLSFFFILGGMLIYIRYFLPGNE